MCVSPGSTRLKTAASCTGVRAHTHVHTHTQPLNNLLCPKMRKHTCSHEPPTGMKSLLPVIIRSVWPSNIDLITLTSQIELQAPAALFLMNPVDPNRPPNQFNQRSDGV